MSQVAAPARTTSREAVRSGVVNKSRWRIAFLALAAAVLLGAMILSLGVGAKFIPATTVLEAFTNPLDTADHAIILQTRLPRTLMGIAVGISLGVAGALIQAITRNPLADPGILGVNAGASFAMVIAIGVFGIGSLSGYIWFAFIGAILTTAAVYLIGTSGRNEVNPIRLTLAGVALGAVLTGIGSGLTLLNPKAFDHLRSWSIGSLDTRSMESVLTVAPFMAAGLIIALFCVSGLNAVALGDDLATSLGANVNRTRILGVVAITLLSGAATAGAGAIGFVGLMIPHVARWIVGPDQRWILASTVLLAPILLLVSDVVGRIAAPGELPVGVVTAFIGAPVLIALARRRKVSGL
ncbi:iron chelate uptake ABC transporter family permease subunit [Paenarthrobacter aurescens]|nr:iron chelate uptake ABC transporter family permease subunit [Paenarthrobacter aurescens]MDO6142192.1 iron chelate uptake ABC transporter family permease subunit [Paenarthrobacter aurescens]MDO6146040.1 iron chelate uptake ABC transporter family permease subunit [Paenarthrobacter aurescens]MDO6157284.1 iron chelate uptake ABC transporter family permease subunit [Paenarthrobacter aurescens]MDO6161269.1 iron chelate uptake ABC transporter family permease subunit [Paenarthrobacter aurescens]